MTLTRDQRLLMLLPLKKVRKLKIYSDIPLCQVYHDDSMKTRMKRPSSRNRMQQLREAKRKMYFQELKEAMNQDNISIQNDLRILKNRRQKLEENHTFVEVTQDDIERALHGHIDSIAIKPQETQKTRMENSPSAWLSIH